MQLTNFWNVNKTFLLDLEQSMRAIEKANRDLDIAKKNIENQKDGVYNMVVKTVLAR